MSSGSIALLADVAAIAKTAAASVDDIVGMAGQAGAKSAGVLIDDAAVTPRYVTGFAADRELPIVVKIARGSLYNKLAILLPAALVLSLVAPWIITPILMCGGLFLCFEGAEKIAGTLGLHGHGEGHAEAGSGHDTEKGAASGGAPVGASGAPRAVEDVRVASAIKTDFILSAEIMAISLASIPDGPFWQRAIVLGLVGAGMTLVVYGAVAVIVKADDAGLALAARARTAPGRALGRGLVRAMPGVLRVLTIVGTAAMLWVGGGILLHGLEDLGLAGPAHVVHDLGHAVGLAVPALAGALTWLTGALMSSLIGLVVGAALVPVVTKVVQPAVAALRGP